MISSLYILYSFVNVPFYHIVHPMDAVLTLNLSQC